MVEIHLQQTIAAPVEKVFDWMTDPANLAAAPLVLNAGWAKGSSAPGAGAVREVAGIGAWFREEITAYDRPRSYSYLIVRSFPSFKHEGGTLTFAALGGTNQGTHVDWLTNYTHPIWAGGKLLEVLTHRLLRSSFLSLFAACAKDLENQAA
jgi:Polyketide cyclase / dehydrase and lipid transport